MDKYQRGKIYKIISPHDDRIYIGSTTEPTLARRLAGHRADYKRYLAGKHNYVSSFEILQYPEYRIVLVELCPCNSKDELLACEQRHIDLAADNCVNKTNPSTGLTREEYNKQYKNQWSVIKVECDCGKLFTKANKTQHERSFIHTEYLKMLA